jgi:4-oxalocrotonate tautomerase
MPIITIEGPEIKDLDTRRALVRELTDAAAKAYGLSREKMIVLIRESTPERVAVGGQLLVDLHK